MPEEREREREREPLVTANLCDVCPLFNKGCKAPYPHEEEEIK
jgi:hypothetical protein